MSVLRRLVGAGLLVAATFGVAAVNAQTPSPAVPAPGAVQSAPLPPPPGANAAPVPAPVTPPPAATITQVPAPGTPPPAAVAGARPTLIPDAGDTSSADEVVLPEKPAVIVSGQSKWEDGLQSLRAAFARLETELGRAGIAPAGRPLAVFTQTTDDDFRFDAMMPIARPAGAAPTLPADMRLGATPSGKAYRFVHKGPYDNIDSTYETITAYLDVKDVVANDAFIEEYVNDVTDPGDPALEINIFVQPK